jgi:TPR repeat protein
MAAERDHAHAQLMLSRYLARGLAGETDPEAALTWLERAAAQGLEEAQHDLATWPGHAPVAAAPEAPQVGAGAH